MSEIIEAYGYQWEVLDKEYEAEDGKGILCLMKEPIGTMEFSNGDNDYATSHVREKLSKLTKELEACGANFRTVNLDLTAEDGTKYDNLSIFACGAFLLTFDMYRKYREFISEKYDWWWLATADSFSYSHYILCVDLCGKIDGSKASDKTINVVPACVFSSLLPQNKRKNEIDGIREQIKKLQERLEKLESEE